jgi:hypothetical protein
MNPMCDLVAERVALGEPLGELAEHAETCASCRRLAALPTELGAMRREAEPGLGFSSRMTAGAQHRIVVRRRRRIAVGLATAVAAGTLGIFVVTRSPHGTEVAVQPGPTNTPQPATDTQKHLDKDPWNADDARDDDADDDVQALLGLANVEESSHVSANWNHITKPLAPYRALVKGIEP